MIGKRLSPILEEIEATIWEFEARYDTPPNYPDAGFRSVVKIFMSALMDRMWALQRDERLSIEDRAKMAEAAGNEVRKLIKTFTGLDTYELYKK